MRELSGKTALVTGAARGIGRAVALELASAGAHLVLLARTADALESVRAEVEAAGGTAVAHVADLTEPALLDELDRVAPKVDVLVNNAACFATYGPVEDVAAEEIARVMEVDLLAAMKLVRHVLPGMKERGFGRILHVGSVAGSLGGAGQVAYSTAKAGLLGLTVSVAVECARRGVTSNLLELGLVTTERTSAAIDPAIRDALVRNTPVGRPGTPEEVAFAVRFLASPRAAFITGAVLPVSGGLGLGLYPEQLA
ncbi:MAG: SDR family oxidoreductase [Planctomycetes bacterium]|nr:SDR family oxidoreductase [Planctomycetota bacterium]MCB9905488.1 SDR family oxidoreductase [Planctomycetota bacterium]